MDFRGFTDVEARAFTRLVTGFHFTDAARGTPFGFRIVRQAVFVGPLEQNFNVTSVIARDMQGRRAYTNWSGCGHSFHLNVDTRLEVQTGHATTPAVASLDSVDANVADGNMKLYFRIEPCTGNPGAPFVSIPRFGSVSRSQ
jgi:hypothetical protein